MRRRGRSGRPRSPPARSRAKPASARRPRATSSSVPASPRTMPRRKPSPATRNVEAGRLLLPGGAKQRADRRAVAAAGEGEAGEVVPPREQQRRRPQALEVEAVGDGEDERREVGGHQIARAADGRRTPWRRPRSGRGSPPARGRRRAPGWRAAGDGWRQDQAPGREWPREVDVGDLGAGVHPGVGAARADHGDARSHSSESASSTRCLHCVGVRLALPAAECRADVGDVEAVAEEALRHRMLARPVIDVGRNSSPANHHFARGHRTEHRHWALDHLSSAAGPGWGHAASARGPVRPVSHGSSL